MKNLILKSSFHEKLKVLIIPMMLLTLGVGQMWGVDLYVRGERNSWGTTEKMEGTSSPWTFTAYWDSKSNFKIADNSWSSINLGSATISAFGTTYNMTNSGSSSNMTFPSVATGGGIYKITVTLVSGTYKIKVDKVTEEQSTWKTITAPKIYWDNTSAGYSNVSMINGRYTNYGAYGKGTYAYTLTQITNTNLWYTTSISNSGDGAKYTSTLFIDGAFSDWENNNVPTQRAMYATSNTAVNTEDLNSNTFLFSAANGNRGATLSRTQLSSGYSELNKAQTIKVYVKAAGGSYTEWTSNWPGTIKPNRYYLSNATTATNVSNTALTPGSSVSVTAVLTSQFKLVESSTATGYTFKGWGTSSSGPTSTGTTYTISAITGTNTIYAFFEENTYTVSFANDGHGTTSPSSNQTVGQITGVAINATPNSGYSFNTWTITSGSGTFASAATTASNTFYPTANTTLTASFNEDLTYYTVTYGAGSSPYNNGTVSAANTSTSAAISSGASVLSGTGVTFTATPTNTHYKVAGWYSDATCTSEIAGAGTGTTYSTTITANTTVYAKFVQKQCAITLNKNGGSAGAASVTATHGSTLPSFTAHTRTGYTLKGYYTNSSSGTKIIDANGALVASTDYADADKKWNNDATTLALYAQWTEKMTTVTVNVNPSGAGTLTVGGNAFTPGNTTTAGVSTSRTVVATASSGKAFLDWSVTGNATGTSSTNTYTLKGNGSAGTGTLTANFGIASGWYMEGTNYGGWSRGNAGYQFARPYRGMENVFYYPTSLAASSYWKVNDGTTPYNTKQGADQAITKKTIYSLGEEWSKSSYSSTAMSNIWVVLDKSNKKLWVQDPQTFYNVNVTGNVDAKGPTKVTLKTTSAITLSGNVLETTQFANGETFTVTVTGVSGWIPTITIGGVATTFWKEQTTYTADGTMGTADVAVTISYTASRAVTFAKTTGCNTLTATGPSSTSVTTGTIIKDGTSITFHQANKSGYTFSKWYSTSTGSDGKQYSTSSSDYALTVSSTDCSIYPIYTANQYAITLTRAGETGYGSGGTTSVTATYNAALPNITTLPTAANGYGFMGYFTDHNGEGTQYYGADGSKLVSKYTTVGPLTLYAYFKRAEITSLTFKNNNVVTSPPVFPADANKITVTAALEPTPAGSTHIDWRMLHGNDNPLDDQPIFGTGTTTNQFALPAGASGTYKIEAVLRMGATAGEGTTLSTMVVQFQVAAEHTVTVLYKCGDETIKSSSTVTGKPLEWTEVVAHKIVGYSFDSWTAGDGITLRDTTAARLAELQAADPTIVAVKRMKAIYDGKLTINYTPKRMIYFYNTLNWSNVYVYFYKNDSYWGDSNQGSGANTSWQLTNYPYGEGKHGKMSPVEPGSKIYYFDADSAGVNASYTNVVFTELNQHGCDYFYNNNKVVRRGDYNATTMPLFVPLSDQPAVDKNGKTAKYYCEGYWMNYPANTGYTLRIYDTPGANNATGASREFLIPFSADVKMPLKQDVEINFSGESWFIIYRNDGKYLEGSHTFKQRDHGDKKITSTDNAGTASKMRLISDGSGIYTFNLSFYGDDSSPVNYDYYLSVDFPAAVGDYRILYKDNATWSNGAHDANWNHPSDIISKNKSATDAKEDIVSFFISKGAGITPSMKFQRIKSISDASGSYGKITWEDVPSGDINLNNFSSDITAAGVYNIYVSQPKNGGSISVDSIKPYTGNYYIRTDCAGETKWNNFRAPDHLMNYSEYSIDHGGYSHYYTHWVQTGDKKNIQFCIANDYSSAISDTLIRESNTVSGWENINTYIEEDGDVKRNANVRFMWNQSTNVVSRAYVDGAQGVGSNNFLYILSEDSKIRNADESSLVNNKVQFSDKENWIYEAYIQAKPNAAIKLLSNWGESNKITQYFKGSSSSTEKLIGGSGSDFNTIRVLYDFKTNRLIAALVPTSGNYESDNAIEADIMFIREHQGDVAQLTFGDAGKISKIETAYGVMRFNKWTMNNKSKEEGHSPLESPASVYERSLFWISFPFKVKLSEVFGFGTYGEHWAVQRYDGADRAARGHFQENGSFWKWMNRSTEYLEPNQGYLLAIDADLLTEDGGMWPNNIQNLELFFPSYGKMPDITSADVSQTIPTHTCEIDWATTKGLPRTNDPRTSYDRTIFDSHWNVISVPTYVNTDDVTFANTTWTAAEKMGPKFLYTWNADDNTITATTASGYTYHAMHAYMTQYYGGITWSASSGSPASIVARRAYADEPKEIEFNLELQQNEKTIDRAFVVLSADEEVSAGFQFGEDMTKEFNASRSAIYTFIPDVAAVAGNTLPMSDQTTVVPVGVDIIAEGEYIISLPEGTSGVGVTLIDNELQTRTNLALTDYAVTLPVGTYDERFVIEISPIEQTTTGVEAMNGANGDASLNGVCKKLIDGVLYIVKDGKVFDARGARIQ